MPPRRRNKTAKQSCPLSPSDTFDGEARKEKFLSDFSFRFREFLAAEIETFEVAEVQVGTAAKHFPTDLRFSIKLDPYS